jgi:hypothetical protein
MRAELLQQGYQLLIDLLLNYVEYVELHLRVVIDQVIVLHRPRLGHWHFEHRQFNLIPRDQRLVVHHSAHTHQLRKLKFVSFQIRVLSIRGVLNFGLTLL